MQCGKHIYDNVIVKSGGPYSLYCTSCHRWIPSTSNAEMRQAGYFAHSHVCCDGVNLTPNDGGIDETVVTRGAPIEVDGYISL